MKELAKLEGGGWSRDLKFSNLNTGSLVCNIPSCSLNVSKHNCTVQT